MDLCPHTAPNDSRTIVDLSHTIAEGVITYPGLPSPTFQSYLSRADSPSRLAPGTEFTMDTISMIGNTGTYLDSPFHCFATGADLASLRLETLVGLRAEVIRVPAGSERRISTALFRDRDLQGAAVLFCTGWDRLFGTPEYGVGAPYLSEDGARHLIQKGATLVGIDAVNIDDKDSSGERPAHTLLLAAGVHIVEHLTNVGKVPERGARFTAVPPKIENFGTFPVRAFAEF